MEFTDDELGTISAALASFTQILEDVEKAKVHGFVPPCFSPKAKSKKEAAALLSRIARRHMS